jgi:hypothetical protein
LGGGEDVVGIELRKEWLARGDCWYTVFVVAAGIVVAGEAIERLFPGDGGRLDQKEPPPPIVAESGPGVWFPIVCVVVPAGTAEGHNGWC